MGRRFVQLEGHVLQPLFPLANLRTQHFQFVLHLLLLGFSRSRMLRAHAGATVTSSEVHPLLLELFGESLAVDVPLLEIGLQWSYGEGIPYI